MDEFMKLTVPGADLQVYLDTAKCVNRTVAKGYIKDPIMSIYYPIDDVLLWYEIKGRQYLYLPLSAFPKELMGEKSQYVFRPDLVCGLPLMPVMVSYGENGQCTVELESSSFCTSEIINGGYHITVQVRVGKVEFAVGEHEKAPAQFVTWERNCKNDGDGRPNYFWGHYLSDRNSAIEDLCDRVKTEFQSQQSKRKSNSEA